MARELRTLGLRFAAAFLEACGTLPGARFATAPALHLALPPFFRVVHTFPLCCEC